MIITILWSWMAAFRPNLPRFHYFYIHISLHPVTRNQIISSDREAHWSVSKLSLSPLHHRKRVKGVWASVSPSKGGGVHFFPRPGDLLSPHGHSRLARRVVRPQPRGRMIEGDFERTVFPIVMRAKEHREYAEQRNWDVIVDMFFFFGYWLHSRDRRNKEWRTTLEREQIQNRKVILKKSS